jgi:hypothetical protein
MTCQTSHTRAPPAKAAPLQVTTVTVRRRARSVIYVQNFLGELVPIPNGVWSTVPASADVMIAIRDGALERKPAAAKRGKLAPAAAAPASKPTPTKTKAKTGQRGRKEYDVWKPMFDYLDKIAATGKKFSSYSAAAQVGHYWLTEQQASRSQRKEGAAVPTVDTVRVKIRKLRPDLASG